MKEIKLNLGSGIWLKSGYINCDSMFSLEDLKNGIGKEGDLYKEAIIEDGAEFVQADILHLPFKDNFADLIECHQCIEHFRIKEVIPALKEIYRVLKPGGSLLLSAPSFNNLCLQWINMICQPSAEFDVEQFLYHAEEFYGYQATEGEHHRCPITPQWLMFALTQAGFEGSTGKITVCPINSPIPEKGLGLVSQTVKHLGDRRYHRTETIYMRVVKK